MYNIKTHTTDKIHWGGSDPTEMAKSGTLMAVVPLIDYLEP